MCAVKVAELTSKDIESLKKWFEETRSRRSQSMDVRMRARSPKYVSTWLRHPNRYDIPGVDAPVDARKVVVVRVQGSRPTDDGGFRYFDFYVPGEYLSIVRDAVQAVLRFIGTNKKAYRFSDHVSVDVSFPVLKVILDVLPELLREYRVIIEVDKDVSDRMRRWFGRFNDRYEKYKKMKRVVEAILRGQIPWSEGTPDYLKEIGKMILNAQSRLEPLIRDAMVRVYGKEADDVDARIIVVDLDRKKMWYVYKSLYGFYKVSESNLNDDSWIASYFKTAKAYTAKGKPIYVKLNTLKAFLKGELNDETFTFVHEALHKAGRLHGPSQNYDNITWVEGGNELVTWKYLLGLFNDPSRVGKFVREHSPYLWEAFTVAAVAKAMGYRNVFDFIRDVSTGKVRVKDMREAIEKKIMKHFSKVYDKAIHEWKKKSVWMPSKRKWLNMIRNEIYDRSSVIANIEYVPDYALNIMYDYAYDVLVNSFPKEFVTYLKP